MTGLSRTAVGPRATVALSGHPVTAALPDFALPEGGGNSAFEDQSLLKSQGLNLKMMLRRCLLRNQTNLAACLLSASLLSSSSPAGGKGGGKLSS